MLRKLFLTACLLAGLAAKTTTVSAAILTVSPYGGAQFVSISNAYAAAAAGDTILVAQGTYPDGNFGLQMPLTIIGAGWDRAIADQLAIYDYDGGGSGTSVNGLTLSYISDIRAASTFTVNRCRFVHPQTPVYAAGGSRIVVDDCHFPAGWGNSAVTATGAEVQLRNCVFEKSSCVSGDGPATIQLYNCLFLNASTVFQVAAPASLVVSNCALWANNGNWGNYPPSAVFEYNAGSTLPPGAGAILLTESPFVNQDVYPASYSDSTSNLQLRPGSPLIDAGNPFILDLDGSRSDIGVYGGSKPFIPRGLPDYPFVVDMLVSPQVIDAGVDVNASAIGRVGPRYGE